MRDRASLLGEHLALGAALLKLKQDEGERFGRIAYERYRIDAQGNVAYRGMAAARLYAARPEITDRSRGKRYASYRHRLCLRTFGTSSRPGS
jgi:hypothetical protein